MLQQELVQKVTEKLFTFINQPSNTLFVDQTPENANCPTIFSNKIQDHLKGVLGNNFSQYQLEQLVKDKMRDTLSSL